MTTLDSGSTSRTIDGISFTSKDDWVIGKTTDQNSVFLTSGDTANVTALGKFIYIGQDAGSDDNELRVAGTVTGSTIFVGLEAFNTGNLLQFDNTAAFSGLGAINLAHDNFFSIQGDYSSQAGLLGYLGGTDLNVWSNSAWTTVDGSNFSSLLTTTYNSGTGYTLVTATSVPEPGRALLFLLGLTSLCLRRRRPAGTV